MGKVITVATEKGGVLKTTSTVSIAGVLTNLGHKVLIIDCDQQGNVAVSFGQNPDKLRTTIYDVMADGLEPHDPIIQVYKKKIDMIAANDELKFLEFDVLTNIKSYANPFGLLRPAVEILRKEYDYVVIDTPPNLGLVTGNVLACVDELIIPFQPEPYSMRSLIKTIKGFKEFRDQHNPDLKILGVFGTLIDSRTALHASILQEARKYCKENGIHFFETVIPRSIRFANSVGYDKLPAVLTDKKHPIVKSFYELVDEINAIHLVNK